MCTDLLVRLVGRGKLLGELVLGDVGPRRVQHVDDHLPPLEQTVGQELARPDRNGAFGLHTASAIQSNPVGGEQQVHALNTISHTDVQIHIAQMS